MPRDGAGASRGGAGSGAAGPSARRRAATQTEQAWRRVREEFGLVTASWVAEHAGDALNASSVEDVVGMHRKGHLLGAHRDGVVTYPSFQFDPEHRRVLGVVVGLRTVAAQHGWSENGLILWLCAPCGRLDGHRPVDCLDRPGAVLDAARASFDVSW